ncbi:GTPase IMAP family member 8-like [Oncorhynchus clarkii lewisi]|uniref:GTPase IMAP family member 8-like n=1 Tax=Oncorhynchus clarkii lewisi TaxID=490388 RepID=UPI0039B984C0
MYVLKGRNQGRHSELRIVLLVSRYSGKSSTGNTILGREEFPIGARIEECLRREVEVFGRRVTVMDIPAWTGRYFPLDSLESAKQRLACPCVLQGTTHFPASHGHVQGEGADGGRAAGVSHQSIWRYPIVLFTGGDALREEDSRIEQLLEREASWKQLVEKRNNRYHVFDNVSGDDDVKQDKSERVKREVVRSIHLCPPETHALLLVVSGDMTFTESDRQALEQHLELLVLGV